MKTEPRVAEPTDVDSLARLCAEVQAWHSENYPEVFQPDPPFAELADFFRAQLANDQVRIWVIDADGQVAAYLFARLLNRADGLFHRARRRLMVEHIATDSRARRRGHARALLREAEAYAVAEGCADIFLDTWEKNEGAQATFATAGLT
ncbi:MAG: GNAT family N-acetyltransferase, partial [Pseudomonadota bacterium]